jgi:glutathione S-transferase
MKLYYAPGACSMAPHIAAIEANVPVELVKVEFAQGSRVAGGRNFYDINPQGAVPALELNDGSALTENQVLLQYIATLRPSANLAVAGASLEHWHFLETLNFIATELHKGFSPLFANPPEDQRRAMIDKLNNRLRLLERKLDGKQFLAAGHFTVADAYAFVIFTWADKFGVTLPAALKDYYERLKQRPSINKALEEEGLLKAAQRTPGVSAALAWRKVEYG